MLSWYVPPTVTVAAEVESIRLSALNPTGGVLPLSLHAIASKITAREGGKLFISVSISQERLTSDRKDGS